MKKLDKLILSTSVGPFIITLAILLFIVDMQFLWKYIDDLVGKGLEMYIILELIFYASASFVPLVLPLAVLLSSIMTYGSLGERYELVAMRSSGVSLWRAMRPLIINTVLLSMLAFYFSNNILPIANLKFASLLSDVRNQKPAFSIEPGVFYTGIEGFSLKVGDKGDDNRTIYDIMVYDLTSGRGSDNVLVAEKGEMLASENGQMLVLRLFNGSQYSESVDKGGKQQFSHYRTNFKVWEKKFDLSQFDLKRSDENLFKDHYKMMSLAQLETSMDTLQQEMEKRRVNLHDNVNQYFTYRKPLQEKDPEDTTRTVQPNINASNIPVFSLAELDHETQTKIVQRGLNTARNVKSFVGVTMRDLDYKNKTMRKHLIEWHRKFTLSIACLVMFFIGAPLGSIIRKGGLAWPVLWSILFFIIFHVFNMTGEELSESGAITPLAGMWMPIFVLSPIAIFITYLATNTRDSISLSNTINAIGKIYRRLNTVEGNVELMDAWEEDRNRKKREKLQEQDRKHESDNK